jgi:DNA adenine methylase
MSKNIFAISHLLKNKSKFISMDYREVVKLAKGGDLIYMDPPYKGVCGNKDSRYYSKIDFNYFVDTLELLNKREINYLISYDGMCGNKTYGELLPKHLKLNRILIEAGRSSQATLLGRNHKTTESLYISKNLFKEKKNSASIRDYLTLNLQRSCNAERV